MAAQPPAADSAFPDLSAFHAPVSDFLALSGDSWPVSEEAVRKYSLSAEQLAAYERDGFIDNVRIVNDAQLERLRAELATIMNPAHPAHKLWHEYNENEAGAESGFSLFHSLGAWRISPAFHDILFLPSYLVPAAQLMGSARLHLWHDQLFCKPARNGAVVAWHQDMSYWTRTKPVGHLTVHITLDTQTEDNGVLRYVPGSHRWPLLPITSRHFNDMDSITSVLTPAQTEQFAHRRSAVLPAGCAAFHAPCTVHGSYGNSSDAPRRATVINLFKHGTMSDTDAPLLEGLPAYAPGQLLEGRFFPLLLDRGEGAATEGHRGEGAAAAQVH